MRHSPGRYSALANQMGALMGVPGGGSAAEIMLDIVQILQLHVSPPPRGWPTRDRSEWEWLVRCVHLAIYRTEMGPGSVSQQSTELSPTLLETPGEKWSL